MERAGQTQCRRCSAGSAPTVVGRSPHSGEGGFCVELRSVINAVNNQTRKAVMARQQPPSPQAIPSTDGESHNEPVDWIETTWGDIEARASTNTKVLLEMLAQGDDRYYVHHWGINERALPPGLFPRRRAAMTRLQ